jgi:hypothetical protein
MKDSSAEPSTSMINRKSSIINPNALHTFPTFHTGGCAAQPMRMISNTGLGLPQCPRSDYNCLGLVTGFGLEHSRWRNRTRIADDFTMEKTSGRRGVDTYHRRRRRHSSRAARVCVSRLLFADRRAVPGITVGNVSRKVTRFQKHCIGFMAVSQRR